jgi:hypothetical protein
VVVLTARVEAAVPLAAGVTEAGVKLHVTVAFTGEIAQESPTAILKPFKEVIVTVDVPLFPAINGLEFGEAVRLKSLTVKV